MFRVYLIFKNVSAIFTNDIQNVKIVIVKKRFKRYYDNKETIWSQQKRYFMKKIEIKYFYRKRKIDVYNLETYLDLMFN